MADRIKGITIEIGGDTTGLNKALSGVNKEIRDTQSQLKDVERLLKLDPSNTELLKQKQKLLADAVGETKNKLDTLKDAERQAQQQFKEGKISEQQYDALKREIIETEQQLKKLEDQAGKSNVALQKIGQAGEAVKEVGGKITDVGQKMMAVTGAMTAVGTASVAAWNTVDEAYDTIAKGTGATGEALEDLQKSFDSVFSSIPTEAATAGTAIADINTRFGFTGEVLEDCTKKFIQFGEVNNTDVSTAIANVSRYMGDAGIESSKYGEVLDQLTAASQASGLGVDKLSESLTKYGAPMRALGFDTEESIAIFAGWEKAGVNTEIAFSGMKQAIGKWSKEGKDARKEFKKTLKEIKDCPDIAEATGKAIEAFGQKAGPDLADAIQGGRFEYEDFLKVLENSAGQLEQTFNDTLDPIDEVKVAMQGLTSEGAVLGGELLSTLAPMITKLVEKIRELTTWFKGLSDEQKQMVVKIGLIVAAIGPLLIVIGQLTTGIGGIMTLVSTLGPAIGALGAVGGPILLTVAAVGALGAAFLLAKDDAGEYYDKAVELTEQEQRNKEKIEELYSSYELMNQRRADAASNAGAEAAKEQELFRQLKDITDANGNVKEGYEERAKYILGELSEALGQEYTLTGNQIDQYGKLEKSVGSLILKKQANALLDANAEAYAEAITNRTAAFMAYNDAQKNVEETTKKLEEAQKREALLQEDLNALRESGIVHALGLSNESAYLAANLKDASETTNGYKDKLSKMNEELLKAETVYEGYETVISSQKALVAAKDNQDLLSDAVLMASNNFRTAEIATRESLKRQVQDYKEKYNEMKAALEAGAPGVTQTHVDNMKRLLDLGEAELDKLPGTVEQPISKTVNILEAKKAQFGKTGKESGSEYTSKLSGGITGGKKGVTDAVEEISSEAVTSAETGLSQQIFSGIGSNIASGLSGGILSGKSSVLSSVSQLCRETITAAKNKLGIHSPSTEFSYIGQMSGEGFKTGWSGTVAGIHEAVTSSMSQAVAQAAETFKGIDEVLFTLRDSSGSTIAEVVKNAEEAQEALQKIQEGLENTISGQIDMFSAFDGQSKTSTDELLNNMQSQVDGTSQWADDLRYLAERGVEQGLLQKMAEMGPKGAGYVTAFTRMTGEELQKANRLFEQMMTLPESATASIMKSYQLAGAMTAQGFGLGMQENMGVSTDAANQMANNALNAIKDLLKIHSPSQVTMEAGQYFTEGFSKGIEAKISQVTSVVKNGLEPSTNYISGLKNQSPIWGRDMMSGFISGVRGKFSELERACREAANTVSDYMHFTRPEKGPLRFYEEWMPHMMEGFSEGIRANTWRVTDQVRALAATVNDSMTEIQGSSMTQEVADGQLIGMLTQYLPAIAGQKYVLLDGKALVGYTSAEMDRRLGEMQAMKVRTG